MTVYVECYPDLALVKNITSVSPKKICHVGSKGNVCNRLDKDSNSIGIIDEDPNCTQPALLDRMKLIKNLPGFQLKVLKDTLKNNYLIIVCPSLEGWIIDENKQEVKKHGLPDDVIELHKKISHRKGEGIDKFKKLINNLKKKSDRLKKLGRLIESDME